MTNVIPKEEWYDFCERALIAGKHEDWSDGLGLEKPEARAARMFTEATKCFREQRKAGIPFHEACDIALGLVKPRGDLKYIAKEGPTPPALNLCDHL